MNCIDSDFAIAILKGDAKAKVLLEELETQGEIHITSVSVFEITYTSRGISKKRERSLMNLLDTLKVLPLDRGASSLAGKLGSELASEGKMIHPMDLLIGATAIENGMRLVTNNKKHFERIEGLEIVGW